MHVSADRARVLLALLLTACGSGSATPSDAGVDAALDSAIERACTSDGLSPARSCTLAAWPTQVAITAPDLTTQAHAATTSVPGQPAGVLVAPDGGWVFTAIAPTSLITAGQVGVLKREGAALTFDHGISLPVGKVPFGLALSGDGVVLAVGASDEVAFFDRAKVEANAADALLGLAPNHSVMGTTVDIAFSRDGALLFACTEYDGGVAVIDVAARSFIGAIPIAGNAITSAAISPDGKLLYVLAEASAEFIAANPTASGDDIVGSITIVDVKTTSTDPAHAVLGRVFAGRAPVRVVLSADGATAWVTARGSNAVLAFDTAALLADPDHALLSSTPVGPSPVGLALVAAGTRLLVANSDRFAMPIPDGTAMLLDTTQALAGASGAVVGQIAVGKFPRELDADASAAFVSNYSSSSLSAIDLTALP